MATEQSDNMTKTISASIVGQQFGQLLEELSNEGQRFVVEKDGRPVAVVISVDEWENILETLSELNDSEYLESIRQSRQEVERGETLTLDALKAELDQGA
jgi:antitoxin YefM